MFMSGCADVNECERGTHNCHENATCTDVVGGFNCTCNTGHTGNGTLCVGKKDGMSIHMTIIGILVPRLSSLRNIAHDRSRGCSTGSRYPPPCLDSSWYYKVIPSQLKISKVIQ